MIVINYNRRTRIRFGIHWITLFVILFGMTLPCFSEQAETVEQVEQLEPAEPDEPGKKDATVDAKRTRLFLDILAGTGIGFTGSVDAKARAGLYFGVDVIKHITSRFGLCSGIAFNQQAFRFINTDHSYTPYRSDTLSIPFILQYRFLFPHVAIEGGFGLLSVFSLQSLIREPIRGTFNMKEQTYLFSMGFAFKLTISIRTPIGLVLVHPMLILTASPTIKSYPFSNAVRVSQLLLTVGYRFDIHKLIDSKGD